MQTKSRDRWNKADIILKPVGGFFAAVTVALVGFFGSRTLERMKQIEMRALLYSELMSKREDSESSLRKDMFSRIIDDFLKPGSSTLDSPNKRLLNLELLVYNFHESLNLKPLFLDLRKELGQNQEYLTRLDKVAREITSKQMLILEGAGKKISRTIDIESLQFLSDTMDPNTRNLEPFIQEDLSLDDVNRNFTIEVTDINPDTKEVRVNLEVRKYESHDLEDIEESVTASFWVGFFDFPMIDNTRLSYDQRCAITLDGWEDATINISLVYYPGTYASLKEKPYYFEVIQSLLKTNELLSKDKII
ncbi:MAG: hypothetical protein ACMUIL_03400 [bacterium]